MGDFVNNAIREFAYYFAIAWGLGFLFTSPRVNILKDIDIPVWISRVLFIKNKTKVSLMSVIWQISVYILAISLLLLYVIGVISSKNLVLIFLLSETTLLLSFVVIGIVGFIRSVFN